jgi:hypothetical protein
MEPPTTVKQPMLSARLQSFTRGQALLACATRAQAAVHRGYHWITSHVGIGTSGLDFERFVKQLPGRGEADPAAVFADQAVFHQFARVLLHTQYASYPLAGYPHLVSHRAHRARLRARLHAQPAWRQVFA